MAKAFSIYWTPEGWQGIPEGTPITTAGGSGFSSRIAPEDRVFVTNVFKGQLRVVGAFSVERVVNTSKEGKPPNASWDAAEYLLAQDGSSTPLQPRVVPASTIEKLRFIGADGKLGRVALNPDGTVYGQAMRAVREVTPESAALLESLLSSALDREWTQDELRASVQAYLEIASKVRQGTPVVKATYYKNLASRFGRSASAFEYRMQNISYVLSLMGRTWVPGLAPARNVGPNIAAQIEGLISEIEGVATSGQASAALEVVRARRAVTTPPTGNKQPLSTTSTSTAFARDPKVKAWVLERAGGSCEACGTPAPFVGVDGFPFLEVHHLRHLADKGSDTVTNAVALCPNCHRRLHYSVDAQDYRETLFTKVAGIQRE